MSITTVANLMILAGNGSNIIVDAKKYTTANLIMLIGAVGRNDGHLIIKNCDSKAFEDLLKVQGIYSKNLTFDFVDL